LEPELERKVLEQELRCGAQASALVWLEREPVKPAPERKAQEQQPVAQASA
jgi:hypothetical protein